ncbi:MAG: RpiB/LacA/LacB family sugar-phosphate isomerase [Parcubacteria group bacterium]|nr:RpiB/LacA/LacB family sugar-phosphate isomerase [Parcubacteria group bacterium]
MKIYIGTDHAGFELKQKLVPFLQSLGHEVIDLGAHKYDEDDDYPDFIAPVAKMVSADATVRGIILGGSGQGEAMLANKFPHIRAGVYYGGHPDIIRVSREHNDANILSLGARFLNESEGREAVETWLATPFSGEERHKRRLKKIDKVKIGMHHLLNNYVVTLLNRKK